MRSSGIPHVHYQLQDGEDLLSCEGLPCVFKDYNVILGNVSKYVLTGFPKTGERLRNRFES